MPKGIYQVPFAVNEEVLSYAPGTAEREELLSTYKKMYNETIEIPQYIGDKIVKSGNKVAIHPPHDHKHTVGYYHAGTTDDIRAAIDAALAARTDWANMSWENRAAIFLKAADLIAGPYRAKINAATMLGQSKTAYQAEIDSACELIDFLRFNVYFCHQIYQQQPINGAGVWNRTDYRPLEGYVFAVTPFNFTAIGGNLPTAPALMGNVVLWKPASSALYSAYYIMRLLQKAGLPPGVINMVAGSGGEIGDPAVADPNLAGLHFTGSTEVFQDMWASIGQNIK